MEQGFPLETFPCMQTGLPTFKTRQSMYSSTAVVVVFATQFKNLEPVCLCPQAVSYTTPRKDIRAITEDNRKAEIFINNRSHETSADGNVFTGIETFR